MFRLLLLVIALVAAVSARDQIIGNPQSGDLILKKQVVDLRPKILGYVSYNFEYPSANEVALHEITGITIKDNAIFPDPTVSVNSGGPGQKNVNLTLKSFLGVGIHVEIIVHGKRA